MSTVIVSSPVLAAAMLSAALPFIAVAGLPAGVAYLGNKALQRNERLAREQMERENREISRLNARLEQLLQEHADSNCDTDIGREELEKNRSRLMQELGREDFEDVSLDVEKYAHKQPSQALTETVDYKNEIKKAYKAFSLLDPDEACKYQCFIDELAQGVPDFRERVILENLKISYANCLNDHSRSIWRKRKLAKMTPLLPDSVQKLFADKLQNEIPENGQLSEEQFAELVNYWTELYKVELRQKENAILEEQLVAQMNKLGYTSLGSTNVQSIHYFNTPEPQYRIQAKVNPENGQLTLRFVHVVASESERRTITTDQKRRSREKAAKWCEASRKLFALLEDESGVKMEQIYRQEPDENTDIPIIVDSTLAADAQSSARKIEDKNNAEL